MGSRELEIEWRGLSDFVRLEIEAGLPDKINVPHWIMGENLTLFSDNKLPRPLIVQLCDKHGNPSSVENVRIQLSKDTGLRVSERSFPANTKHLHNIMLDQKTSKTLGRHCTNGIQMFCVCWVGDTYCCAKPKGSNCLLKLGVE